MPRYTPKAFFELWDVWHSQHVQGILGITNPISRQSFATIFEMPEIPCPERARGQLELRRASVRKALDIRRSPCDLGCIDASPPRACEFGEGRAPSPASAAIDAPAGARRRVA